MLDIVLAFVLGLSIGTYVRAWIRWVIALRWTRGVVSFVSSAPLPPNAPAMISVANAKAFRLERLILSGSATPGGCADWLIGDILVDGKTQLPQKGAIPGDMFSASILDSFVSFSSGRALALQVTYVGPNSEGAIFCAAGIGRRRR